MAPQVASIDETTKYTKHIKDFQLSSNCKTYVNLSYEDINSEEKAYNEGVTITNGTMSVDTGKFTGRSPKDKFIVESAMTKDTIGWGDVNQKVSEEVFDTLYAKVIKHYNSEATRAYIFNGYCGANKTGQLQIQVVTEFAWQHHFCTNMFIRPEDPNLSKVEKKPMTFPPDFTILNACKVVDEDWKKHGLHSEVFALFNIERKIAIIGGTYYGGEMKKGIFSVMNYNLPLAGTMSMHASANCDKKGENTAIFFGLSGTGKTTLSADPNRLLIGDDEHGWNENGVYNFEGGCYAKTINLTEENEPDICHAIKQNALLENIFIENGVPAYDNTSKTENGRVSYPIQHIQNIQPSLSAPHAKNIIFLTCDAYGVLPPIAKLTSDQAQYHFLSGYTAKVAGTERGITEPQATFSSCFGSAFMTLHPTKYADLLKVKIDKHKTNVYLVNTGWSGGGYGVGKRMSIKVTRQCVNCILDGSIEKQEFVTDPLFQFKVPKHIDDSVPDNILNPINVWSDKASYEQNAKKLACLFQKNYKQFIIPGVTNYSQFGPTVTDEEVAACLGKVTQVGG